MGNELACIEVKKPLAIGTNPDATSRPILYDQRHLSAGKKVLPTPIMKKTEPPCSPHEKTVRNRQDRSRRRRASSGHSLPHPAMEIQETSGRSQPNPPLPRRRRVDRTKRSRGRTENLSVNPRAPVKTRQPMRVADEYIVAQLRDRGHG